MTYDNVLQELRQNGNAKPSGFNNNIINSGVPAIGCTIPFVRKLAKRCSLAETANFPVHNFFEVDLLRGITVADCKLPFSQKSLLLAQFADTIENWAVCDYSVVKVPRAERELYFALFCDMLASDKPFVCRYGTVNLFGFGAYRRCICPTKSRYAMGKLLRRYGRGVADSYGNGKVSRANRFVYANRRQTRTQQIYLQQGFAKNARQLPRQ